MNRLFMPCVLILAKPNKKQCKSVFRRCLALRLLRHAYGVSPLQNLTVPLLLVLTLSKLKIVRFTNLP